MDAPTVGRQCLENNIPGHSDVSDMLSVPCYHVSDKWCNIGWLWLVCSVIAAEVPLPGIQEGVEAVPE